MSRLHARAGHTLLEILLALGLSLVILAAAYAALEQHSRYADAGQRQIERMQVTRALFERLSLDLRAVVFRPAPAAELAGGTSGSTHVGVLQPTEHSLGRSIGIVGGPQELILQIDAPGGDQAGGPIVRWKMHAGSTTPAEQGKFELVRIARRETVPEAVPTVSPEELSVAEVETIRFRYFKRGSWVDHWDSVKRQELPSAVEITLGFGKASATQPTTRDRTGSGEYRLVVAVPASEA